MTEPRDLEILRLVESAGREGITAPAVAEALGMTVRQASDLLRAFEQRELVTGALGPRVGRGSSPLVWRIAFEGQYLLAEAEPGE